MKELSSSDLNQICGGNRARRHQIQRMREDRTGGKWDRSRFNCVTASVVGAGMSMFGTGGAMAGAGFAAYVCTN